MKRNAYFLREKLLLLTSAFKHSVKFSKKINVILLGFIAMSMFINIEIQNQAIDSTLTHMENQQLELLDVPVKKEERTNLSQVKSQGTVEELNLLPSGTGSSHFYESGTGDPLWTYADPHAYYDSFWTPNPSTFSTQSWNPENRFLQDSISQVPGSTDFDDWIDGVGSIRLDAPRREHVFRLNDSNAEYSLSDTGGTPDPTGGYSSFYDSSDGSYWGYPDVSNYYYPGNMEGFGGTNYLASYPTSFANGAWDYGNTKNEPTREIGSVDEISQTYSVTTKRYTWYELYYDGAYSQDRINAQWDTTVDYETEFRLYFTYYNTSSDTHAAYGAGITLFPISDTEQTGVFDVDINGTIQYDVFKNASSPIQINEVSDTRSFEDDPVDGSFPSDSSLSISQSADFGDLLESGTYFLRILINVTHHMYGSYQETSYGGVSQYFSDEIGLTIEVSDPYVEIYETTPINPDPIWGSTVIDPDLFQPVTHDIAFDSSTTITSNTWTPNNEDGSFSHSIGYGVGNARLVLATVSFEDDAVNNITSISYDGQTMHRLEDEWIFSGTRGLGLSQWYLLDAELPSASGSYTVNVDMETAPIDYVMVGISNYINIKQTAPYDVDKNSLTSVTSISTTVDTETDGSWIISSVGDGDGTSTFTHDGTGAVKRWEVDASSADSAGGDIEIATAGTNNVDQFTYGVSQYRVAMISSVWSPYSSDPIVPANTYKYMGSTSPDFDSMTISNLHIYVTDFTTLSLGVWTGGLLTDPTGASLLVSQFDYQAQPGWNNISIPQTPWQKNTNTWIGFATNGSAFVPYTTTGELTHFNDVSGAWNQSVPIDSDPTNEMPSSISAGEFLSIYYAVYLEYEKGFEDQTQIMMESDWVDWGENRFIAPDTTLNLSFGYQIPSGLRGTDGNNLGLEYGNIITNLTVEKEGIEYNFSHVSTNTFADVRGVDSGYGIGCDKFIWTIDDSIKSVINYSTRIKWKIGIQLQSQFQLGYNYSVGSRIYFNNVNCSVVSERSIYGTFNIKDLEGNPENALNITIFDQNNISNIFFAEGISGSLTYYNFYLGQWRILINKTIPTGETVIIYNSTKTITLEQDFTDTLYCNLTNIIFNIKNYDGNFLTAGNLTLTDQNQPDITFTQPINGTGQSYFTEIYNSDWKMLVTSSTGNTVMNFSKTINSLDPQIPENEKYLITNALYTTYQINLTNIEINVLDPTNFAPSQNIRIEFRNVNDLAQMYEGVTDLNGNATIQELYQGNWNITFYSANSYVIFKKSNYNISPSTDLLHLSWYYNLTNLEFVVTDYANVPLDNSLTPEITLSNLDDDVVYQAVAIDGEVSFLEVYNGTSSKSWNLKVGVTYLGQSLTIYNASYPILTNVDKIADTIQANLTKLKLTIYDRDNSPIESAMVNFTDATDVSKSFIQYTDTLGRVNINEFYDTEWILKVRYNVSGEGASQFKDFTIFSDISYEITLSGSTFETEEEIFNCNLTTLELYVLNNGIERQYAGLYKANVTLRNFYQNENFTTLLTDPNGYTSVQLPAGIYNFSVVYQGENRDFHFNDTGNLIDQAIHSKTISSRNVAEINITLTEFQTKLSIQDIYFGYTGIDGWNEYNGEVYGESYQIVSLPNRLNLYRNDSVEFEFFFEKIEDHSGIFTDIIGSWNLTKEGVNINSSTNIDGLHQGSGLYNLTLFTQQYSTGSYELTLEFGKTNYLTSFYTIIINILPHTTQLDRVTPVGAIQSGWYEDLIIQVNFTTVLPESGINITNAEVLYSISDTPLLNIPLVAATGLYLNTGIYELNISKHSLDVGIYTLIITASKGNFSTSSLTLVFEIVPVQTQSSYSMDSQFQVTPTYMKVAYGENFTILANFTYYIPSENNYSALINVDFQAYLDTVSKPVEIYEYLGDWQFLITDYANLYSAGVHTLYIIAEGANHETQSIQISVEILDFWETSLDIIQNPYITPWANNASFILEYAANEAPRSQTLEGAMISELEIYSLTGGIPSLIMTLSPAQNDFWSWSELGSGQYQVWLNTSIIQITGTKDFYVVPTIGYSVYASISTQVLLWITPLETKFTLTSGGNLITSVNLILDENLEVEALLTVSDALSGLYDTVVNGAAVSYGVYNSSNNVLVELGTLTFTSSGIYLLNLDATKIGEFIIKITMTLNNYTLVEIASFNLYVGVLQAQYSLSIGDDYKISDVSLKVSLQENITFLITYEENLGVYPDLTAIIGEFPLSIYYLGSKSFLCTTPASNFASGDYSIEIISNQQYADPVIKYLDVEIIEYWDTVLLTDPFDFTLIPWNNISHFSVQYVCTEAPRNDMVLEGATISSLQIKNSNNQLLHTLTATEQGTLWDWSDIGNGEYEIWMNTSFIEVLDQQALFVSTAIYFDVYSPTSANSPISVRPIELTLDLFEEGNPLPSSFELPININKTITASLSVSDGESALFGTFIPNAQLFYIVFNASDDSEVFDSNMLYSFDNGTYQFNVSTYIEGSFRVSFYLIYSNYTLESTPQFLFNTGLEETLVSISITPNYRISESSIKVASGENITFSIFFENFTIPVEVLSITVESTELTYSSLGSGLYLVSHPANVFSLGLHQIHIVARQEDHQAIEQILQLEIIDFWDSRLEILVPPIIYPWNNISTFKIRYQSNEFPRVNQPLLNGIITNLTLTREIEGNLVTFLQLDATNLGEFWGWTDLGTGDYSIWINTSIIPVSGQSVIYTTPYIYYDVYRAKTIEPYIWIRPVETSLSLFTDANLHSALEEIELYLDQNTTIYSFFNVTDTLSSINGKYLDEATVDYEIYRIYPNNTQILYQQGTFLNDGFGQYHLLMRARDLGQYLVRIHSSLDNFSVASFQFSYSILQKPILLQNQDEINGMVVSTPRNRGVNFTLQLNDFVHNEALTDAIVEIKFGNDYYHYTGNGLGEYLINFSSDTLAKYDVGTYTLEIQISKTNYSFTPIFISFNIELPVDQYFNVPYLYWIFIGATAFLVSSVVVTNRIIKNAKIPLFVKQLLRTKKLIAKNKDIEDPIITLERNEEYIEFYRHYWDEMDIDLTKQMEEN